MTIDLLSNDRFTNLPVKKYSFWAALNKVITPRNIVIAPCNIVTEPRNIATEPRNIVNEPPNIVTEPSNIVTEPPNIVNEPRSIVPYRFWCVCFMVKDFYKTTVQKKQMTGVTVRPGWAVVPRKAPF